MVIAVGLVVYSQTVSFDWDEGFHLLAARLINAGRRPYLDFLFAQTPLNAYWNAFLMRVWGDGWRTIHAAAALETAAAAALIGVYILLRFPAPEWRTRLAIAAVFLLGCNQTVFDYGTLGQAYGLCLLLTVAAFWFAVLDKPGLAGLTSGAAAAASLLTAPVGPVLLLWMLWRNRAGRAVSAIRFAAGAAAGTAPFWWFLMQAPRQVVFDVVGFHLFYRQIGWSDWLPHDLGVMTAWLDSAPAFILVTLGLTGLGFLNRSGWELRTRQEFWLCGWLTITMILFLMAAHPTFGAYFVLAAPFGSILSAAGFYAAIRDARRPVWLIAALVAITVVSLCRTVQDESEDRAWRDFEQVAAQVDRVTAPGAMLHADEHVYFLTRRLPPPGMEWGSGHKIEMPLERAAGLHVLPQPELDRRIEAGEFSTFETCGEGEIKRLGLKQIYKQMAETGSCFVFWELWPGGAHPKN